MSVTAVEAAQAAPQLSAGLASLRQSRHLWQLATDASPDLQLLRVTPSTLQESSWTLMVPGNAEAAKLRQSAPKLAALAQAAQGRLVEVRIKISKGLD